ncbi:MAG TPA: GerMN domain-containing protein [Vicinamibacterales bacterium]|nr:GerMN domain-containing protein [Vicinamibacterales bacterium]
MLRLKIRALTGRQWLTIATIAAAAIAFALIVMTSLNRLLTTPMPVATGDAPAAPAAPPPAAAPAVPRIKAILYFASEDGQRLVPTEQEVPLADGVVAQARSIVEAQLAAQPPAPLVSTIPQGATLRGLFVSDRNEAFVDLDPSIRAAHPGGTLRELMTVYTIVHAVVTNLPNLQEVQILIGGQEADTLAGHIDLRRPLRKNERLILPASPPAAPTQ